MKVTNNKQGVTLCVELEKYLKRDSVLSISTGCFTMYALRESFSDVANITLLSSPITKTPDRVI